MNYNIICVIHLMVLCCDLKVVIYVVLEHRIYGKHYISKTDHIYIVTINILLFV